MELSGWWRNTRLSFLSASYMSGFCISAAKFKVRNRLLQLCLFPKQQSFLLAEQLGRLVFH